MRCSSITAPEFQRKDLMIAGRFKNNQDKKKVVRFEFLEVLLSLSLFSVVTLSNS